MLCCCVLRAAHLIAYLSAAAPHRHAWQLAWAGGLVPKATAGCGQVADAQQRTVCVIRAHHRLAAQVVIFVKSVARARELSKLLVDCNFPAICIHSSMQQEERCACGPLTPVLALLAGCLRASSSLQMVVPAGADHAQARCGVQLPRQRTLTALSAAGIVRSCTRAAEKGGKTPQWAACRRLSVYKQFKEGQKRVLVATDLIGRGIDIERVNIVVNYDMPETDERKGNGADTYLHRVRLLVLRKTACAAADTALRAVSAPDCP